MEGGSQESEDEASNQNIPLDDAIIERAAAALFQICPLPKARLGVSSVVSTAKSVGVDLPEHVAEYLGDRAMRELRHAILIATQFNRHERAPGLRTSDFTKALKVMNCFDSENPEDPQRRLSQEDMPESAATSVPLIYLHRFPPDELDDAESAIKSVVVEQTKIEDEGSWQGYSSNMRVSAGDKESPGHLSGGNASFNDSTN